MGQRLAGFRGPAVERRLDLGAVALALGRARERAPMVQALHYPIAQHERILAGHAQELRPGAAAEMGEAPGQIVPQPDDMIARPSREIGADAALLLRQRSPRTRVVAVEQTTNRGGGKVWPIE